MPIHYGRNEIGEVYYGRQKIKEVYYGRELVYVSTRWVLHDDFNDRSNGTVTNNGLWEGAGGWIRRGQIGKDGNQGESRYWSVNPMPSNNIQIEAVIGSLNDRAQMSGLRIGGKNQAESQLWVGVDFSQNATNIVAWDGTTWPTLASLGRLNWSVGDTIGFSRSGNVFTVRRNGAFMGESTFALPTTPEYRHVGMTFNMDKVFVVEFRSTDIDEIRAGG